MMSKLYIAVVLLISMHSICFAVVNESKTHDSSESILQRRTSKDLTSSDSKLDDYETSDSIPHMVYHLNPNSQYPWMNPVFKSKDPQSGWFGFNHFVSRTARNLPMGIEGRVRSANLLGETSQIYPMMDFFNSPHLHFEQSVAVPQIYHEYRNHPHVTFRNPFIEHQVFPAENQIKVLQRYLSNSFHHQHQNSRDYHHHHRAPNHQASSSNSNYNSPLHNIHRSETAPTPVTIKIVPLKINSFDIANVFKSMSWVPIPLDFLKLQTKENSQNGEGQAYDDKNPTTFDDEEGTDLPPPSSHVATPFGQTLGVTYADSQRSEQHIKKYNHHK